MKKQNLRFMALAYLLALVVLFMAGCVRLAKGAYYENKGLRVHQQLGYHDLEPVGIIPFQSNAKDGKDWFVSTDADPQFHLKQEVYLESVQLDMQQVGFGGATVLYWKTPGQQDFSEAQSVYGREIAPGSFLYELNGVKVSEIRLDPDSAGGIITRFDGLTLNPQRNFAWAFCVGWKGLLMLLTVPLFLVAAVLELKVIFKK